MDTKQVIQAIRDILGKHEGSEKDLLEQLCEEAEGWSMRLEEIDDEE